MFPTKIFENKHVLVGITGGVAAYKACEIIRYLVTQGADVRAMMSKNAQHFITETTIETLCNYPVYTEMFPDKKFAATHHISAADWSDVAVFVPATANIIGKMANGIADDFISTCALALNCPVVIAPAMNQNMWLHPAMKKNIETLRKWNYFICEPETGFLAEGYSGVGRLARPEYLSQYLYRAAHPSPGSLSGKTVLITAGRTEEYLDPVRMFTNRSTGRMGFALAWEAFARGAEVVLIHGPGNLTPPVNVQSISVTSAKEMHTAVKANIDNADIFISAAAVADYQPEHFSKQKLKKTERDFTIQMVRTPDILKQMAEKKKAHQQFIGFAVETESPVENSRKKLIKKGLDMIVINNPLINGAAFAGDTNVVTLLDKTRRESLKIAYKLDVSKKIFEFLLK